MEFPITDRGILMLRKSLLLSLLATQVLMAGELLAAPVTHGVVAGDVRADSAVIWSRTDREAVMNVQLMGGKHDDIKEIRVKTEDDYTGKIKVNGLRPDTEYRYRVWFGDDGRGAAGGRARA